MFQLNAFHFWLFSKEKIILFTKHMRIQSRSYNKNKRSFSINPFAPHSSRIRKILFEFEFVHLESGFFYLFLFFFLFFLIYFLLFFNFYFLSLSFLFIPFHHSLSPIGLIWSCRIWPIFSSSEGYEINQIDFSIKSTMLNLRFFPLPLSLSHRYSVWINREPFLLYESILLHSNSFPIPPKENPELDPKLTG